MFDSKYCGLKPDKNLHCNDLKGKVYMAGAFYFMSQHLARHITSPEVDSKKFARYEDMDMGMRVATYTKPVNYLVHNTGMYWRHGLKEEDDFRKWWKEGTEGNTLAYLNTHGWWHKDDGR